MKRVQAFAGSLLLAAVALARPLEERVPLAARPFPLTDVRLREGPFLDAMRRDQEYLLSLDVDRLLHTFRLNAGLPSKATPLGGWEAPEVELRGHSLGHFLTAGALMYAATGDPRFQARADQVVAELAIIQPALAKRFNAGYLSAFPEELFDRVETRQRVWAPYYTVHKIMAGLLDVQRLCGNAQALDLLRRKADWVKLRLDRLTEAQRQAMLETEFGGMQEVLADLYAVTGDPEHLRLARLFDHRAVFDPLARGEDRLDGLHANTQIPKAIGAARLYELTGEARYRDIASFFWERVARHRSYVNGGHSDGEAFFPTSDFRRHLGSDSSETCNTYNMLKLTRHLFSWAPSAGLMDFYERGLINHILASQDPATGGVIYYCPLKPGAFRTYSKPDASFWCCVGTGMENHAKYADTIYFHDESSLYVNLFVASELAWKDKDVRVVQETRFPEEDTTRLTFGVRAPARLALKVRHPAWARSGITVDVNGRRAAASTGPGSYLTLDREWRDGDVATVRFPMSLRTEELPGDANTVALLYGPVVLAGDLGRAGLSDAVRYGPSAPPLRRVAPVEVPALLAGEPNKLLASVQAVPGQPLTFRTAGLGHPRDVTLLPFYKASDLRYTVYWKLSSPAEWEREKADAAAAEKQRQEIAARAFDRVDADDPRSEAAHGYRGESTGHWDHEGRKIRETRGGWFSYEMKVRPDAPMVVAFTYLGTEGRQRTFDVLVDGVKVATKTAEYHPTELLDAEYPIPAELTRGKEKVTVRFQAPDSASAAIFEVRTAPAPSVAPVVPAAPPYQSDFPPEEFKARWAKVYDAIGAEAVAAVQGAPLTNGFQLPRQSNTFYYLSGIETPGSYLVLDGRSRRATLYLPPRNERLERSEGKVLSADDAEQVKALTGADEVRSTAAMADAWPAGGTPAPAVYVEFAPAEGHAQSRGELRAADAASAADPWDGALPRHARFAELLRARNPRSAIEDLTPVLDALRAVKSPREIALVRRASQIAGLGLMEAMRSTQAGVSEYQLDAAARYVFLLNDARLDAYRSITASGTANIWNGHYFRNTSQLKDGDLVLMDYAPDYRYYVSDIGRVWPVSGRYLPWQRELLQFILEWRNAVLSRIRPGVAPAEIYAQAREAMAPVLARTSFSKPAYAAAARKLLETGGGTFSHTVGMAVHDVGSYRDGPLRPGQVFSVDPQLWVPEENLYLRYEDTVVVTETGVENFTAFLPSELDEMEALVREQGIVQKWPALTREQWERLGR